MIKIAICEDDGNVRKQLHKMLTDGYGDRVILTEYSEATDLLDEWEQKGMPQQEIILMDIQFSDEDGISVARRLQERFRQTVIIFMTGHLEYAGRIFEAEPSYFLVKPIDRDQLKTAVDRAVTSLRQQSETIAFPVKNGVLRLYPEEITYVESKLRQAELHGGSKTWTVPMKLDDIENLLPGQFLRVHQSYLVNMEYIRQLAGKEILLYDDIRIPVSRSHVQNVREGFMRYLSRDV